MAMRLKAPDLHDAHCLERIRHNRQVRLFAYKIWKANALLLTEQARWFYGEASGAIK